jgi:hypothetical protein
MTSTQSWCAKHEQSCKNRYVTMKGKCPDDFIQQWECIKPSTLAQMSIRELNVLVKNLLRKKELLEICLQHRLENDMFCHEGDHNWGHETVVRLIAQKEMECEQVIDELNSRLFQLRKSYEEEIERLRQHEKLLTETESDFSKLKLNPYAKEFTPSGYSSGGGSEYSTSDESFSE